MRPKTCDTCSVLMEILLLGDKITFACNNPNCYQPNFVQIKINTKKSDQKTNKSI